MEQQLTLVEHLNELRKRIIVSLISLGIATIISFPLASYLLKILKLPAAEYIKTLVFFSPQEAFMVYMRIAFFSGLLFALPIILFQLWAFVSPAIEERFSKYAIHFIFLCSFFFIAGCLFAYFILIPPSLRFLLSFAKDDLEPVISAQKYISFVIGIILGGGIVFQMPVLSFLLAKIGIVNAQILRRKYKYAIIIIFIVAAIITPTPDVFNMLILSLPMLLLYEISIWVSCLAQPRLREDISYGEKRT